MRRSQASASAMPAPAAGPLTMAIVGFGISCSSREISIRPRNSATACSTLTSAGRSAMFLTSPPAQKARPAPVRTTAPTPASPARRGNASDSASIIGRASALSRSGRLSVKVATPSTIFSISCCSIRIVLPRRLRRRGERLALLPGVQFFRRYPMFGNRIARRRTITPGSPRGRRQTADRPARRRSRRRADRPTAAGRNPFPRAGAGS